MDSSNNLFYLYFLRLKTYLKNIFDFFLTAYWFYSYPSFKKVDLALLKSYWNDNPYTLSRRYLEKKGESTIYAYGETPLRTLQKIVQQCEVTPQDVIYELGCGRGRTCFWLNLVFGSKKVVGIDFVPEFIEKAETIRRKGHIKGLSFRCEDFLKSNLSDATVIYLHGSCMDDRDIIKLSHKLMHLKPGLKVITVSFSLADYDKGNHWKLVKTLKGRFTWGPAEVFLQVLDA